MFEQLSPEIKGVLAALGFWMLKETGTFIFARASKKYEQAEEEEEKKLIELSAKLAKLEYDFIKHQTETQNKIHAINNDFAKTILHIEKSFDEVKMDIKGMRDLIIKTLSRHNPKE